MVLLETLDPTENVKLLGGDVPQVCQVIYQLYPFIPALDVIIFSNTPFICSRCLGPSRGATFRCTIV